MDAELKEILERIENKVDKIALAVCPKEEDTKEVPVTEEAKEEITSESEPTPEATAEN